MTAEPFLPQGDRTMHGRDRKAAIRQAIRRFLDPQHRDWAHGVFGVRSRKVCLTLDLVCLLNCFAELNQRSFVPLHRSNEEEVLMARLLEKALRRSEAVDREALCLVAGQTVSFNSRHRGPRPRYCPCSSMIYSHGYERQVWHIKVDVHFLNDCGNMLDCASIAAITALRHFRKPDVTVNGEDIIIVSPSADVSPRSASACDRVRQAGICQRADAFACLYFQHSMTERVPVPLAIHHSPICLTYAFFNLPNST